MKKQASKTLQFAIAAAAWLLLPVFAAATLPPQIKQPRSAQQAKPAAATPASAQYRFVIINAPGALATQAYGINNTGLVTGAYQDASFNYHGFSWRNGALKTLDYPGAMSTVLGPANDPGTVIGNYGDATTSHAATYDIGRAVWTTLPDIPDQPLNFGDGINNSGVGSGTDCQGNTNTGVFNCVGWTWDGSVYSFFIPPGADEALFGTFSNGINNRGQVVGFFLDSSGVFHGFLKDGDSFTTIDVPGGTGTFPFGINDPEVIAGYYNDASGAVHGFTESHGRFTTVDVPGAVTTLIFSNNDRGDLSGEYIDSGGVGHGFVAFKR